ncbi:hypothetical protein MMC22_001498 [Lobaria immixta]|nr:hypothetical protein [Lobaria immixta]
MTSTDDIIIAFDFYGTLVNTNSVIDQLSEEFGRNAAEISSRWRRYQLEYTWRLNSMGAFIDLNPLQFSIIFNGIFKDRHESFSVVTKQSLIHALKELDIPIRNTSIDSCMARYECLTPFPGVGALIAELKRTSSFIPLIFSNADRDMMKLGTLNEHEQYQGFEVFREIVCVDATRYFKPHPDTYHHLAECTGREKSREGMSKMWLVSANPFDIVGAINVGMETVWVDRDGGGWKDQLILGKAGTPSVVVNGLEEVVQAIRKYTGISQE